MSRCWCQLVHVLARALQTDEREAVLGDCVELRMSSAQTCREVAGLLLRRQLLPWMQWRPWLALLGVLIPLGLGKRHLDARRRTS